jgi:HTH-type transcriptional repressor of NAD biosynthesis genes
MAPRAARGCAMSRFATGLVVGKFAPLHRGHELLIRAAAAQCDRVVVLSYTRPEFPGCEPARRAAWLAHLFPATVRLVLSDATEHIPDNLASDEAHRSFCHDVLRRHNGLRIDAIFSSEDYGPGFAADLARRQGSPVTHVAVDPARTAVPVSGTALRADVHAHRAFLDPEVYASFVDRVALLGGESTGKTTLASALAAEFSTPWVAEYGRELWERRDGRLAEDDLLTIAREQVRREEAALRSPATRRFVLCDTTPLTTLYYALDLFGRTDPELWALAARPYAHTFLCADDFPFAQDGTRRDPAFRARQQAWYRERLAAVPHAIASGSVEERLKIIRRAVLPPASAPQA